MLVLVFNTNFGGAGQSYPALLASIIRDGRIRIVGPAVEAQILMYFDARCVNFHVQNENKFVV